jgi:HD-GYP domain-containing protein (c-di-GMP phosphodiesterase class II)
MLAASTGEDRAGLTELARVAALVWMGEAGEAEPPADAPTELLSNFIPAGATPRLVATQLRGAFRHAASLVEARRATADGRRRQEELAELTRIGVALAHERDLMTLLDTILSQARRLTCSDAGSLYLTERTAAGELTPRLRFKLAQNFTHPAIPLTEFTVPIDNTSLAGYAAATGLPLAIADVYLLPADVSYQLNRSFDEKFGYRTKSMLVIPMKTHRDEIIGVLQLINRKRVPDTRLTSHEVVEQEVLPYDTAMRELVSSLAAQAGVAIENSLLYEDIERLFEGFVTAAVTAIEQRDPATSGHSGRVATLTVSLAEVIDRLSDGPYRDVRFSRDELRELRYAGLLHDFGKVGVREQVLVKQKKLYPADLEVIRSRFGFLLQGAELEFERARADLLTRGDARASSEAIAEIARERDSRREELTRLLDAVVRANEPTVLPEGSFEELAQLGRSTYIDFDGTEKALLQDHELQYLMIRKGNLDDRERREIESHVTHTFRFLQQIPWTRSLRRIPIIAYGHHEKLNGVGYPRRVGGEEIPVQTRMMTISDIFDALTAADRPYKRAVPWSRALDILNSEAREGMLDSNLLEIFIGARVFEAIIPEFAERG